MPRSHEWTGFRHPQVADQTRRTALEALLDDFDWMDAHPGPGDTGRGMDSTRLRKLLGLPGVPH